MLFVVRFNHVNFIDEFAIVFQISNKRAVFKMPWVQVIGIVFCFIIIVKALKNEFAGVWNVMFKLFGYFNVLIQLRIIMNDTAIPNGVSIEVNYQTIVDVGYMDPIFFFHGWLIFQDVKFC